MREFDSDDRMNGTQEFIFEYSILMPEASHAHVHSILFPAKTCINPCAVA